jgi:zinc transporter ZupT
MVLGRKATGFLLVVGSGLATTLGAGVVLSPKLASLSNTKFLGAALAVSCGVMLYVAACLSKPPRGFLPACLSLPDSL